MKSRFEKIRDDLIDELIYYRDNCYGGELDTDWLEELLIHIVDIYLIHYEEYDLLQDELMSLRDFVHSNSGIMFYEYDERYEIISRVLILMEAVDNKAFAILEEEEKWRKP